MIYHVFYRNSLRFSYETYPSNININHYNQVAVVKADDLHDLFRQMNTVDGSDDEIPVKIRNRSMCVGDVVVDEKKTVSLCRPTGWDHFRNERFEVRAGGDRVPRFNC